jgi:hypothetical protein
VTRSMRGVLFGVFYLENPTESLLGDGRSKHTLLDNCTCSFRARQPRRSFGSSRWNCPSQNAIPSGQTT